MNEQRNLIIAIAASMAVLIGFNFFYDAPKRAATLDAQKKEEVVKTVEAPKPTAQHTALPRSEALAQTKRISLSSGQLKGSVNLKGAILDDISLVSYRETPETNSPHVDLLNPERTKDGYYCEFGWQGDNIKLPNNATLWETKNNALSPESALTLQHNNGEGLVFERTISVDDQYMFQITDKVTNTGKTAISLKPYAQVVRHNTPKVGGFFILHEGPIGVLNGKLQEFDYQKLVDKGPQAIDSQGGWLGITDKYWLVALIPQQKNQLKATFQGEKSHNSEIYRTGYVGESQTLQPGESILFTHHAFTGAKKLRLLDGYEEKLGFDKFDLAVDFGWFYFLTKPLFYVLELLNDLLGNLGIAILALTVIFKALTYPLASKSYKSMAKMKRVQPEMERIRSRYENDKVRMQEEMMRLYQKEKINPAGGCLPMLIQMPIFFCLYKVLFVTIEMRHAPFFGWINDLSAPDPTTIFNLFGLIPWAPPAMFMIGLWPILMGLTMWIQQKMSPQPTDPAQAKVMLIMPVMLTYMMASFPAGLVIYWAWSNILGIGQQWLLTRNEKA